MSPWLVNSLVVVAHPLLALAVTAHIVQTKTDVRAAIGWVGLVWLTPVVGAVLYAFFGINRIRRQAGQIRRGRAFWWRDRVPAAAPAGAPPLPDDLAESVRPLATLVGAATGVPLVAGNDIEPLMNGDAAYPAMLAAIDGARRTIALTTYIFDRGQVADQFVDALSRAVQRGVVVRVLIDGVGARYSRPPIAKTLRARGITVAHFLPPRVPWARIYVNLRNHRKLMVVDGRIGFCGGLNIRDSCVLALNPREPTQDMHFRICGPIVGQLMSAIAFDWAFAAREQLAGPDWFPPLASCGSMLARGISDGPDEDFETILMTLLGALSQASRSVRIVTPYFLPDAPLIDALRVAAMRGVRVEIVLPARGNLLLVQWAADAQLGPVVQCGCSVYLSPPPFDHAKLCVVDDQWSLIGSANWDPRSLRLNFEYEVESYSTVLAARLGEMIDARIAGARLLKPGDIERRRLAVRVRDGIVWLAQPYL